MYDDYTYLYQYTEKYLRDTFANEKFEKIAEFDEGRYPWNEEMSWFQKTIAKIYTKNIFHKVGPDEHYQKDMSMVFKKT